MTGIHSVQVMLACATVAHDELLLFMYNMDFKEFQVWLGVLIEHEVVSTHAPN
jgi:hypothetical protein